VSSPTDRYDRQGPETVEDRDRASTDEPGHALVLLFGRVHGARRRFVLGHEAIQLGREVDPEHHVQLDDHRASRRHAEIGWSDIHRAYWVRDLESRNGVHLNGQKVARELLHRGDLLRVGETVFRFATVEHDDAELAALDPGFVGASASFRRSFDQALKVAASNAAVLILGATGTGKQLVAEAVHRASRRAGPLVTVNCAALPGHLAESELFGHEKGAFSGADGARPGLFRAAERGTLFLDEVGELASEIQAKLLRVLDASSIRAVGAVAETPVDVRIVAATNRDLADEVSRVRFRADLYARLSESVVRLQPLCERPEDLEPLWHHFVAQLGDGAKLELSGATFEAMALHRWPFNVRELRQLARSALLLKPQGGVLTVDDLPAEMRRPPSPDRAPAAEAARVPAAALAAGEAPSARQLRQLIEQFHGNVKEVAAFIGKDRKQIYRWLRRHNIDPDAYRRRDD
jgi:DNA-binding NtrC family response regulator